MDEVTVDVEERRAVVLDVHDMARPKLVVESLCHGSTAVSAAETWDYKLLAGARAGLCGGVERHHLLRVDLEVGDAVLVRGVRGKPLRRLAGAGKLGHLLPERDRGLGVIAGARRKL